MIRLTAAGLVAALLALLGYGVVANRNGDTLDAAIARGERRAAPAIALPALSSGAATSLSAFRGRVVLLNYWASWCTPCRQEAPLLQRWQATLARRGGTVLGIDTLDVTTDARAFIRDFHITYPVLRDRDGQTQKPFGVRGFPETMVLDRRGRVADVRRGPVDDAFLRRAVLPLLGEAA